MSIRTSKNSKGQSLSDRSPVKTLLSSEFQAAMAWIGRKKDKTTGKRYGKISRIEDIVKYGKDTFSLYGFFDDGRSASVNDIRGEAVFLRLLPNGKMHTADVFLFCLGAGDYILTDWLTVWKVLDQLTHDHGTVIYRDAWRFNRDKFVTLLMKAASGKI